MFALGCGDTGGRQLSLELLAHGSPARPVTIRGGSIELTSASIAFGPLYLCASRAAEPELCESALGEWRDVAVIDGLADEPVLLGELSAVTGTVRSGQLDYGISWLLTRTSAQPTSDQDHSVLLEGRARGDDGSALTFEAAIDVVPVARGGSAIQLRTDEHTLKAGETLTLQFNPNQWLSRVRYAELALLDEDADGHVVIEAGTQPYEAIAQALSSVSGAPGFAWD